MRKCDVKTYTRNSPFTLLLCLPVLRDFMILPTVRSVSTYPRTCRYRPRQPLPENDLTEELPPLIMEPLNDLECAPGATSCLAPPIECPLGAVKRLTDSLLPLIIGYLNDLPGESGETNRLSPPPRAGPLNVLSGATGSKVLPSAPRGMPPSRTMPGRMRSTLLE